MTVPVLDLRQIRAQVSLFNDLAEGVLGGRLAIRSGGLDPGSVERGRPAPLPLIGQNFLPGAVGPATDLVLRLNREPGRNVSLAVVIDGEEEGAEPSLVPGFAVAIEDQQAAAWAQRLPFLPTAVLATGAARFVAIYLLDRPALAKAVAPVARYVAAEAGGVVLGAMAWPIAGAIYYTAAGAAEPVELALPWQSERANLAELARHGPQAAPRVRLDAQPPQPGRAQPEFTRETAAAPLEEDLAAAPVELAELAAILTQRYRKLDIGSDVEIARKLAAELTARFGEIPYCEGRFWHYEATRWVPFEPGALRLLVHAFDGANYMTATGKPETVQLTKHRADSILHEAAAIFERPDFFAAPPIGINCASGFIAFAADGTPALRPHDPDDRCRHSLPGHWDKWAAETAEDPPEGSLMHKLLTGSFAGDADANGKRKLTAELSGSSALGVGAHLSQPKAFVFHGPGANNGKSQFLDMIRGLLPPEAAAALPAGKFGDDRRVVHLAGKHLNACDELSSAAVVASDRFKQVISGDPISGRDVYRSAIEFRPMAQHIFATNVLPLFTGGLDRGVQRRLQVLEFTRSMPPAERIKRLGQRIAVEEGDLALAFAVAGASRLIRNGGFTEPPSSRRALTLWLFGSEPVVAWMRARLRPYDQREHLPGHKDRGVRGAEAFADFRAWAKDSGFREGTLPAVNGFIQRLTANCEFVRIKHTNIGNRLVGGVIGDIREEEDEPAEFAANDLH
jgi:putative DNA primase/helicase